MVCGDAVRVRSATAASVTIRLSEQSERDLSVESGDRDRPALTATAVALVFSLSGHCFSCVDTAD